MAHWGTTLGLLLIKTLAVPFESEGSEMNGAKLSAIRVRDD
jgi:hypothetical protein